MDYFIFGFSLIICIACFWGSIKMLRLYFRVNKWQRINAKIISKEMFVDEKAFSAQSPYSLKVSYGYEFNQQRYTGHHVYLVELVKGKVGHMQKMAEKALAKMNDTMLIYVNPQKPEESVMYCKGVGLYVFILLMGIFSLTIGLAYIIK